MAAPAGSRSLVVSRQFALDRGRDYLPRNHEHAHVLRRCVPRPGRRCGTLRYDVAVNWTDAFFQIFGETEAYWPFESRLIAWGDQVKVDAAIGVLKDALISDGFTSTSTTSYL